MDVPDECPQPDLLNWYQMFETSIVLLRRREEDQNDGFSSDLLEFLSVVERERDGTTGRR